MNDGARRRAHRARVLEAALLLCLAWPVVRLLPFRLVAPLLGMRCAPGSTAADAGARVGTAESVRAALQAAAVRLPWGSTCLMRALAGRVMLGRRGAAALVRIGVTGEAGRDRAHAWLVADGIDVSGGRAAEGYSPIADFVSTGGRGAPGRRGRPALGSSPQERRWGRRVRMAVGNPHHRRGSRTES